MLPHAGECTGRMQVHGYGHACGVCTPGRGAPAKHTQQRLTAFALPAADARRAWCHAPLSPQVYAWWLGKPGMRRHPLVPGLLLMRVCQALCCAGYMGRDARARAAMRWRFLFAESAVRITLILSLMMVRTRNDRWHDTPSASRIPDYIRLFT